MVVMFLLSSAGVALGEDRPETTEDEWVPNSVRQDGGLEPKVTPYYLRTVSGAAPQTGTLSPAALNESDALAETTVNGPVAPRILINNVGSFRMYVSRMPLAIYGVHQVALWAKSNEDVQGAQFRVHLQKNGANQRTYNTQPSTLTSAPMELTVSNTPQSFTEPLIINPGESVGIFIQYTARSRYPVGPAPGAIMLSNTLIHATRIELVVSPIEMNVTAPVFIGGKMSVTGRIVDTSDVDPTEKLLYNLQIIGSGGRFVRASQITQDSFAPDDEKVLVNWTWDYKKADEVMDGLYEFKLDVSYGVFGVNYTNSSFYEVTFPEDKRDDDGLFTGFRMVYLYLAIGAVVAVIIVLFVLRSRAPYPRGYPTMGRPPKRAKPPKKKKPSRKERKAMKKAKRGLPPPAGPPPSPDRSPMPGRGQPHGGAPPPRSPGAPHGSPQPGAARPRRR
jgi:hypothetical protein